MRNSFNEFLLDFAINYEHHINSTVPTKTLRAGQMFFNLLSERRPDIADAIRGSEFDPYYQEEVSDETMDKVELLW